ncbi:MAG: protein kinase domain-containing protein [Bryobacteraceae bacterium]
MGNGPRLVAARNEEGRSDVTPERWQEVKAILASALERAPEERHIYLDEACTEPALRREVESLILAHEQSQTSVLTQPALQAEDHVIGARLGPYEILARIGAGGMGVVYRARDTKLGRFLALKFLREGPLADQAARAGLLREAQHASSLNHPNIATIYAVGEEGGHAYIAMELVEGRPLSTLIARGGLPLDVTLRYGLEISSALAHAHERGIVHRDLKPANVVITADGRAKVLDFGLAKRLSTAEIAEVTVSEKPLAETGAIVGTLRYMAPETLRGEPADARTDLWALGVVLYEMATGTPPFQGRTPYELSSAILQETPRPLTQKIPPSLQSIIRRSLAKEREQRYQRATEVHAALEATGSTAALDQIPSPAKPRRRWVPIAAGACVLLLLAGGFELFRSKGTPPAESAADWVQLTDFADSAVSPALSPDGRMLAFIRGDDTFFGPGQINAKVLPNGEPVRLTDDSFAKMDPHFSPDGSTIAYTTASSPEGFRTWVVPVLGGEPRLMLPNAEGLTWIDSDHLLFSEIKEGIHMAVVTATENRSDSRNVYVPPRERGMAHRSALSPDGKWVLLAEMENNGWLPCRVVPFDGSSEGKRVGPQGAGCTYVAWSPDGKWMYLSSAAGGRFHIWRQRFPNGKPEQLTSGATEEEGIAVAPDGGSLITSVGLRDSTVWVRDAKGERQVSSEGYAQYPEFSRDGKKLYYLVQGRGVSGKFESGELWVVDIASDRSERVLPGPEVSGYDISPDGKQIVYAVTDKENLSNLWLASLDLSFVPRRFRSSSNEDQPHWDAAGNIYFRATEGRLNFAYRMKKDGSERVKVLPDAITELEAISPDGRWAVAGQGTRTQVAAVPVGGGTPVVVCPVYCEVGWSADGRLFSVSTSGMEGPETFLIPTTPGESLPVPPPGGFETRASIESIKGAKAVKGYVLAGPAPGLSAFVREDVHRNLYRVPLR